MIILDYFSLFYMSSSDYNKIFIWLSALWASLIIANFLGKWFDFSVGFISFLMFSVIVVFSNLIQ